MSWFKTTGIVKYDDCGKVIVVVDNDIANYYRKLIPKYYYVKPQRFSAHITVVRHLYETNLLMVNWKKHEGESIDLEYNNYIEHDGVYFFLNVRSKDIGEIRQGLGLSVLRKNSFGENISDYYHITIGNVKE